MNLSECTKFANENLVCYIATADGNKPHVRAFMLWYADDTGFYFHSGTPKAVCQQLKANPNAEVCFFRPPENMPGGQMLRVAGKVEFIEDRSVRERLLNERPFLKAMGVQSADDPNLAVFRIYDGEAWMWTMDQNWQEHESEKVRF